MKRNMLGAAVVTLVLMVGCTDGGSAPAGQSGASGAADYTVVAKNRYVAGTGNTSGRTGYYVTIMLFGAERETQVTSPCYSAAALGRLLPISCR